MIKSIVAALDGSAESLLGLELGASWADRLDAEFRAVFVEKDRRFVEYPTYSESEGTVPKPYLLPEDKLKEVQEELEAEESALQERFNAVTGKHQIHSSLRFLRGSVKDILIAEAHSADLTIIGKKGALDAPHLKKLGPIAEFVIREAMRPVLVVPEENGGSGPALIAFDGSKGVQRVLPFTVDLILAMGLPATVLTVSSDPEVYVPLQMGMKAYLEPHGIQADFRLRPGKGGAAMEILDLSRELDASMIVMGAFSHTPLAEFFLGSVTREVLADTHCPVLMMT